MQRSSTSRGSRRLAPLGMALLGACQAEPETAAEPVLVETPGNCAPGSFVTAELFGAIERSLDWQADEMRCESMRRPDDEGVRLRFTGTAADRQLAIIVALPDLERGRAAAEIPAVVTLTVEGSGRFFSTPNLDACWTDIHSQDPLPDEAFDVEGTVYCVAPLGEINGDAAISIPRLDFRSAVDWGVS